MENSVSTFEQNGTVYQTQKVNIKGSVYAVTVAKGEFNYVNVRKATNNPFGVSGKEFKSFDHAQQHYKCPEIKTALLKIELGL